MAPTMLSKVNTFLEFTVLLLVIAAAAQWLRVEAWLPTLFWITFATVLASGAQYVWVWGGKAINARKKAGF